MGLLKFIADKFCFRSKDNSDHEETAIFEQTTRQSSEIQSTASTQVPPPEIGNVTQHPSNVTKDDNSERPPVLSTVLQPSNRSELFKTDVPDLEALQVEIFRKLYTVRKYKCFFKKDILTIWNARYYQRFYENQTWYDERRCQFMSMEGFYKIMSILIVINFNKWDHFHSLFIEPGRGDKELPFPKEFLIQLLPTFGLDFHEMQYAFCPRKILEQEELQDWDPSFHLPWTVEPTVISGGAYGTIEKGVIAKRHLNSNDNMANSKVSKISINSVHSLTENM